MQTNVFKCLNKFIFGYKLNEPGHDKTYKTCTTSKGSDQPVQLHSLIRVLAERICLLQPPGYPKRDKQEPLPYWVDVQADLSRCCSHRSYCRFCCALTQIWAEPFWIHHKKTPDCMCLDAVTDQLTQPCSMIWDYCPFDISWKDVFCLVFYFKWKYFVLIDHILSETVCLLFFCVLFSNIYTKLKLRPKVGLTYAISIVKWFFGIFV